MAELIRNQVVNLVGDELPVHGLARVLWLDPSADRVMVIPLNQRQRCAPQALSLKRLLDAMERKELLLAHWVSNPLSLLTDDEITCRFPPKGGRKSSFPLTYRAFWWAVIEPITLKADRFFSGKCSLGSLIEPRAKELKLSKQRIYLILYRYWAQGSTQSVLLPDTPNCGGKGKLRAGKRVALGRKRLETHVSQAKNDNYALTQEDIDRIQFGWRTFMCPSVTIEDAYIKTLQLFWVNTWDQQGHDLLPNLMPISHRPSQKQFQYHGERQDASARAYRKHLSDNEWALNHRALTGKKRVGLQRIGAIGQADTSTNDVHLVSVFNRTKIVGPCSHLLITDEFTGIITGFYVGWSVDSNAVKLAMLHSASSKVDYCARYGITVSDDEIPQATFTTLRVDRGEFNSDEVRHSFQNIHSSIEYIAPGRADGKGLIEAKHHTLHTSSGHKIPGTTLGQMKKRGELEPALSACINIYEYTADMIRAVIHHNTKATVPELLTTEMRRDEVAPTRIAIWQWARRKGYVAYVDCCQERLIVNLCPQISAVVKANGIYLVHQRGNEISDEIIIQRLRYLGEFATRSQWLEDSRRKGSFRIRVRYNPYDLQCVWYVDPDSGVQRLDLVAWDPLLVKVATLTDILNDEIAQKTEATSYAESALQSKSDMAVFRESQISNAKKEQRAELKTLGKAPSKNERLKNRKDNRLTEIKRTGKVSLPVDTPTERTTGTVNVSSTDPLCDPPLDSTINSEDQAITDWLNARK